MGVDYQNNRMIFTSDSAHQPVNLWFVQFNISFSLLVHTNSTNSSTRSYVAAAYASIFAATSIQTLQNRTLALSELAPTGFQVATAITQKHSSRTLTTAETLVSIHQRIETGFENGMPVVLAYYCRKFWGTGEQRRMIGADIWDVEGYEKLGVEELIAGGLLNGYREMPPAMWELFGPQFEECQ